MTAHWGIPDPAAVDGTEEQKRQAFRKAFSDIDARIKIFTSLRLETLDRMALQHAVDEVPRQATGDVEIRQG